MSKTSSILIFPPKMSQLRVLPKAEYCSILSYISLLVCQSQAWHLNSSRYSDGLDHVKIIQGVFFNCSSPFSVPKWETSCSQPRLFLEIFNVEKLLIGKASSFHFGTENGEKKHPMYFLDVFLRINATKLWPNFGPGIINLFPTCLKDVAKSSSCYHAVAKLPWNSQQAVSKSAINISTFF